MKLDKNKTYGLSLSGGGARGAYEIGAWKALIENDIKIGAVCGTSIGAINGALIAQGDFEVAIKAWETLTPEKIFNVDSKGIDKIRDISKLKEILNEYLDEYKIRNSPIDFGLVTIDVTSFKSVILFKEDIPKGDLIDYILASANFPVFYRQKIDDTVYIDGGIFDNMPSKPLYEKGYKDIIQIDIRVIYNMQTKKIKEDDVNLYTIKSKHNLYGILSFTPELVLDNINKGYFDTKLFLDNYISTYYYIKDKKNNPLLRITKEDIKLLLKNEEINQLLLNDKVMESIFNYAISFTKKANKSKNIINPSLIISFLELSAKTLGVDELKEYSLKEFINEIYNKSLEVIDYSNKVNNIFSKKAIEEIMLGEIKIDDTISKTKLLGFLLSSATKEKAINNLLLNKFPQIAITYITITLLHYKKGAKNERRKI